MRTLAIVVAMSMVPGAQTPEFASRIEAIRVDVLVTEDGRPVLGLGPGDFEVRDNGVLQTVELASYEETALNVVLVLDMSASVDGERLDHLRTAGNGLLADLRQADQAGLITFSHAVSPRVPLTADRQLIHRALDDAATSGQTALVDASFAAMMMAESDVGRSLVIVFSDGLDTGSWLRPDAVLEIGRRGDSVVYGVTAGKRRSSFLDNLASATGGRLIELGSTRDVGASFRRILAEFRQRYLISYTPKGVTPGGWHRLDVRVNGSAWIVRARPGYESEN